MKHNLLLFFFISTNILFVSKNVTAQHTIKYAYDSTGNRTNRTILFSGTKSNIASPDKKKDSYIDNINGQTVIIYPNPTSGLLNVDIKNLPEGSHVEFHLYSLKGELLISKSSATSNNELDLSTYPIGTYVLKIYLNNKMSQWKVVKQ